MIVAGIDPGRDGCISVLDTLSDRGWILKLRYCDKKILKFKNLEKLPSIDFCFLEDVRGRGGWKASVNFSFGSYFGQMKMALDLYGHNVEYVEPKIWVNYFDSRTKISTKERTLGAYKKYFPHLPIKPRIVKGEERYNHNLIDSLMIAVYGLHQLDCPQNREWDFEYVK